MTRIYTYEEIHGGVTYGERRILTDVPDYNAARVAMDFVIEVQDEIALKLAKK